MLGRIAITSLSRWQHDSKEEVAHSITRDSPIMRNPIRSDRAQPALHFGLTDSESCQGSTREFVRSRQQRMKPPSLSR